MSSVRIVREEQAEKARVPVVGILRRLAAKLWPVRKPRGILSAVRKEKKMKSILMALVLAALMLSLGCEAKPQVGWTVIDGKVHCQEWRGGTPYPPSIGPTDSRYVDCLAQPTPLVIPEPVAPEGE